MQSGRYVLVLKDHTGMEFNLQIFFMLIITDGPEVTGLNRLSFQQGHHNVLVLAVDKSGCIKETLLIFFCYFLQTFQVHSVNSRVIPLNSNHFIIINSGFRKQGIPQIPAPPMIRNGRQVTGTGRGWSLVPWLPIECPRPSPAEGDRSGQR